MIFFEDVLCWTERLKNGEGIRVKEKDGVN
jgi:hypothetical protein